MKTISVKAVKRADFGKKAAKAIRREGMVPCVLCGNGETETFSVDPREIKPLIYTPNSYIVEFDIEGKKEQAVLREAQFHPVREEILHLDFYRIAEGKPVSIAIPVRLTGNAEGVKVGGKLALSARKLVVSALVENLPDEIVVDVTELGVGKTIFVGDLDIENLKFNTAIASLMTLINEITAEGHLSKDDLTIFIKLLSPFAPHICEEIWEFIGGEGLLAVSEWPKYDEGKTIAKTVEIGVQVNGKVRGTIVIPNGCEKEKAFEIAKADERIASFLEGKNLIKEIYVPNKIVNFVAK